MDRASHLAPYIDQERCTGCGCCVISCPSGVLSQQGGVVRAVSPEDCGGCGECELVCPQDAIEVPFAILWGSAEAPEADRQ